MIEGLSAGFIADTAYAADAPREAIAERNAEAMIRNNPSRSIKYALDVDLCKQRQPIECCFSKRKQFRRVATRLEKTARNFHAP